ncbi:MAG: hypothetical protein L3J56_12390, partial [Bacteroidales bacterium]|nr:hypothetical protein [Bacteroidales bacterium]
MCTNKSFFTIGYMCLFLFLSPIYIKAQSKVQKLYESENYNKCINLSNRNISKGTDILNSSLYKSLSIIELYNDK